MIDRDKYGNIMYYSKLYTSDCDVDRTDVSTPKQYGMWLLNRKRCRKRKNLKA